MKQIKIKVYSDFICPWCYIGKIRLERVSQNLQNELDIIIDTKPYILYPHIPIGGSPKSEFAKKTKPGMGRSLRHEADKENIEINYKLIDRIPNSIEAHRLISLIPDLKLKLEISKDIFKAYFLEGKNIEDARTLITIASQYQLDQKIINLFNQKDYGINKVIEEISEAKNKFISLVPTIELHSELNILGLQSADVWENYFRRTARMLS